MVVGTLLGGCIAVASRNRNNVHRFPAAKWEETTK